LALGRNPGIVDQRFEPPALGLQPVLHHGDGFESIVRIGEVDLDVVLRASFPGAVFREEWREQVMTRQPAKEKRFTAAWPMPRLAPVRTSVLRSSFGICAIFGLVSPCPEPHR